MTVRFLPTGSRIMPDRGSFFILALLLYGAWVTPRVRYILGSAAITVLTCWLGWRTITKWVSR